MAKKTKKRNRKKGAKNKPRLRNRVWRWFRRTLVALPVLLILWIGTLAFVTPPPTFYMMGESRRLGAPVKQVWIRIEDIAPVMARSVVAAEDAKFCLHWGFDMAALRDAIEDGGNRGASTLTQQVVKNVFLWNERSYVRKSLEALLTPVVEVMWSKRRIVEVYLNVAEFDEGVFGVQSAAKHYYGVGADKLSPQQAALLAAILPSPKERSAVNPGAFTKRRAESILDGAATIDANGSADCFQG